MGAALTETSAPRIPRRASDARIPLGFAQEPLWLAELLAPGDPVYNQYEALHVRGALDAAALEAALATVVARHELLRTAFRAVDGEPCQIVLPTGAFPLEVVERPDLLPGASELDLLCREFVRRPFDFSAGRMARALLVRLGPSESILILAMHHIVRDGWAMGVLLDELSRLLDRADGAPALDPLPIQYADYALWQRRTAEEGALDEQRRYWRERLTGAPLTVDFPADGKRSASGSAGRHITCEISAEVVQRLRALATSERASFFMTLTAAFQTFVHRCTGLADLLTGFPVAGRGLAETKPLIACCINTAVLRTTFVPNESFRGLLGRVRLDALAAYANADFPFVKLVEELRPERRPGESPIVQTMVTLIDPRRPKLRVPGAVVEPYPLAVDIAKLDLALEMLEHANGLTCRWEYRTDLFSDETAAAMLAHFATLLASIAADPDVAVDALALVSASDRAALFALGSGAVQPVASHCIDERIRAQAQRTPDATAVVCGDERLTYAELDAAADALADRLRMHGAKRESLVAVLCEPSAAMVVAVLGVLKTGAAYLPIDARYPPDRLRAVIEDARPVAAVADALNADRLRPLVTTLVFGEADDGITSSAAAVPAARDLHDLAYVMYTSGTTGTPKGVAIEHRSIVAYVDAIVDLYDLRASDVVLQFTSLSFDTSVQDIFATLSVGATLAVAPADVRSSPLEVMELCERVGVTLADLPTAFWHILIDDLGAGRVVVPPTLRVLIVGGEPMSPAAARTWLECTGVRLINGYGPTETTIQATVRDVTLADADRATVPVGRPLPNVRLCILDGALAPVPRGAVGQLAIGGSGVARGYLQRADLTAERFVPDVMLGDGSRMYLTGDLARFDGDGLVHVLGRNDGQVKIRGFRIETADIESAVLRSPSVRACAVVVREDAAGAKRLVAYIEPADAAAIDLDALTAALRSSLPEYMLPAIVTIDALPMTITGKIDRSALPAPDGLAPSAREIVEPRDDLERALVALWEELLERRPIGIRDNFFDLGGHSLLAARMTSQVERRLGLRLAIATLFRAQTIEDIATALREGGSTEQKMIVQLQAGESPLPLFFMHGDYEGGGMYCSRLAAGLGRDRSLFVVRPHSFDDGWVVPPVEQMAAERVRAIRAIQPHGPYALGGYCIGGTVALEAARQLIAEGESVPLVTLIDAPLGLSPMPALQRTIRVIAMLLRWPSERESRTYVRWHRRVSNLRTMSLRERVLRLLRTSRRGFVERTDAAGRLAQAYSEVMQSYRPRPYAGRVLMVNSREDGSVPNTSPIDWSRLARASAMHVIDSDHETLVREHAAEIGTRMRSEFETLTDAG